MIDIAIVRPGGGRSADEAREWGYRLYLRVRNNRSLSIQDIDNVPAATHAKIARILDTVDVALFYCHGHANTLFHVNNTLIDGDTIRPNGRLVILAMACHSALKLAPKSILKGVRAYLGFCEKVYFVNTSTNSHANLTGYEWNRGMVSFLAKGATLRQVEGRIKDGFAEIIDRFRDPNDLMQESDSCLAFAWAHWNMRHLRIEGDGSATANGSRRGLLPLRLLPLKRIFKRGLRILGDLTEKL